LLKEERIHIFWKGYFWFLIILLALYHPCVGFPRVWEVVDLLINILVLAGIFGLAWERKIFTGWFWRIFLLICFVWTVFYHYVLPDIPIVNEAPYPASFELVDTVFSMSVNVLAFSALYLYAFRRNEFWD